MPAGRTATARTRAPRAPRPPRILPCAGLKYIIDETKEYSFAAEFPGFNIINDRIRAKILQLADEQHQIVLLHDWSPLVDNLPEYIMLDERTEILLGLDNKNTEGLQSWEASHKRIGEARAFALKDGLLSEKGREAVTVQSAFGTFASGYLQYKEKGEAQERAGYVEKYFRKLGRAHDVVELYFK